MFYVLYTLPHNPVSLPIVNFPRKCSTCFPRLAFHHIPSPLGPSRSEVLPRKSQPKTFSPHPLAFQIDTSINSGIETQIFNTKDHAFTKIKSYHFFYLNRYSTQNHRLV